jgi:hypothetical protein
MGLYRLRVGTFRGKKGALVSSPSHQHDELMNARASSVKKTKRASSAKTAAAEMAQVSAAQEEGDASDRKGGRPRVATNSGDVFGAAEVARQVA